MRKVLLLICIAFGIFAFGWPTLVMPYTNYVFTTEIAGVKSTTTYNFKLNGKVSIKSDTSLAEGEQENYYYKISFKNKQVKIADNKKFENARTLNISNIYTLNMLVNIENSTAKWISVGVVAFAVLLVVTIPSKKKS